MSSQPIQLVRKPPKTGERQKLVRRAKLLAWAGVGWRGESCCTAPVVDCCSADSPGG